MHLSHTTCFALSAVWRTSVDETKLISGGENSRQLKPSWKLRVPIGEPVGEPSLGTGQVPALKTYLPGLLVQESWPFYEQNRFIKGLQCAGRC